jgi:hypothetical protein
LRAQDGGRDVETEEISGLGSPVRHEERGFTSVEIGLGGDGIDGTEHGSRILVEGGGQLSQFFLAQLLIVGTLEDPEGEFLGIYEVAWFDILVVFVALFPGFGSGVGESDAEDRSGSRRSTERGSWMFWGVMAKEIGQVDRLEDILALL